MAVNLINNNQNSSSLQNDIQLCQDAISSLMTSYTKTKMLGASSQAMTEAMKTYQQNQIYVSAAGKKLSSDLQSLVKGSRDAIDLIQSKSWARSQQNPKTLGPDVGAVQKLIDNINLIEKYASSLPVLDDSYKVALLSNIDNIKSLFEGYWGDAHVMASAIWKSGMNIYDFYEINKFDNLVLSSAFERAEAKGDDYTSISKILASAYTGNSEAFDLKYSFNRDLKTAIDNLGMQIDSLTDQFKDIPKKILPYL